MDMSAVNHVSINLCFDLRSTCNSGADPGFFPRNDVMLPEILAEDLRHFRKKGNSGKNR
jgi:hypothetical protein